MMAEPMSIEKAREIAKCIASGRKRYGAQFSPPYRAYEIVEACVRLAAELEAMELALQDMVPREELTKANRQYAALNARYERLRKKEETE